MLTKRQKEVLDFITSYQKRKEYAPSLDEIRKKFKLASVSTAHFHVSKLRDLGYISKEENKPRSIETSGSETMVKIPLLGTIAAGEPIEAIHQHEFISIPKNKLPKSGQVYALRVAGNSMSDENIRDGDVVLVKQQEVAENKSPKGALIGADEYREKIKKQRTQKIRLDLPVLPAKNKCFICHRKQDADGRCECVNADAW